VNDGRDTTAAVQDATGRACLADADRSPARVRCVSGVATTNKLATAPSGDVDTRLERLAYQNVSVAGLASRSMPYVVRSAASIGHIGGCGGPDPVLQGRVRTRLKGPRRAGLSRPGGGYSSSTKAEDTAEEAIRG
jgi:hypothetical protein